MLRVENLTKYFDSHLVLGGINLEVNNQDILAVIGPSGSGKSTLIRCMNMLELPSSGSIVFDGKQVINAFKSNENGIGTGELRRRVGMVFQHFNLYPHRTVLENVTQAPILVNKESVQDATTHAKELLESVGLVEKIHEFPNHLSGGQKQRVAIARALAMRPNLLLLDEVTSALDPELVGEVLQVIKRLANQGMTMVIVTHEMAFAGDVANKVIFMEDGQIKESGSPAEILVTPSSERLKLFLSRHLR
ncbi:amino acid ABC transporter ATP-binding protein [Betaproteobacteria bacterium LSUCC0117]|nr:amino acid ABC transporter ATP-binding protein [Betaproteobacteria bacterium LSUCC0117]